jgi:hypothetical protein
MGQRIAVDIEPGRLFGSFDAHHHCVTIIITVVVASFLCLILQCFFLRHPFAISSDAHSQGHNQKLRKSKPKVAFDRRWRDFYNLFDPRTL